MNDKPFTNIQLNDVGKRFNFTWIFQHIDLTIETNTATAILGANGSGKSTLMQCIAGYQTISEGQWKITRQGIDFSTQDFYKMIAIAAPYQDLIDDFTFEEMLNFHFSMKKILPGTTIKQIISISGLDRMVHRKLLYFSSGMRQRVKLILAIFSDIDFLFLDEPCSNFDKTSMLWYNSLIAEYAGQRAVVVCSNHQSSEMDFCSKIYELESGLLKA